MPPHMSRGIGESGAGSDDGGGDGSGDVSGEGARLAPDERAVEGEAPQRGGGVRGGHVRGR